MPRSDKGGTLFNHTHTTHSMTKAKNVVSVLHELKNLLLKSDTHTLRNSVVMANLGFSPQSWPRWLPYLLDICDNELFTSVEHKDGWTYQTENYKISYVKKAKIWKIVQQPLMKYKTDTEESIPMTEQDHEKTSPRDSPINY